jgi:hypothetical protein
MTTKSEIGRLAEESGITYSAMWKRLNPERTRELNQRSNRRDGKRREQKIAWDDAHGNGKTRR